MEKYWGDYFAVVSGGEENWRVSRLSKEQEGEKLEMMENDTLQRFLLRKKYFFSETKQGKFGCKLPDSILDVSLLLSLGILILAHVYIQHTIWSSY